MVAATLAVAAITGAIAGLGAAVATAQDSPGVLERLRTTCTDVETPVSALAALLAGTGPGTRGTLMTMASSPDRTLRWCGLRGLAALRDAAVVPAVRAAWRDDRDEAWRIARWAAFAAGGPDPAASATFAPLVEDLGDATLAAAGDDGLRLLGEIDTATARARLARVLDAPPSDAALDAAIHALARQGEVRVRSRVAAIGSDAVATRSGNTTYEQARRMGAVAFYQLALGPDTLADGLAMLRQLAQRDQEDTAAWAVQTLCERAVRRPAEAEVTDRTRQAVVAEFARVGVRWDHLSRGMFPCRRD